MVESGTVVASGKVNTLSEKIKEENIDVDLKEDLQMQESDVYKEFRIRGYSYR